MKLYREERGGPDSEALLFAHKKRMDLLVGVPETRGLKISCNGAARNVLAMDS